MTFFAFSRDLKENYCRNPDGQDSPWCFTMDPRVRIMFCTNIPQCSSQIKNANGKKHYLLPKKSTMNFLCHKTEILGIYKLSLSPL